MQIQVNTDSSLTGSDGLTQRVTDAAHKHLKHLGDRISRLEVHFTDENKAKHGVDDKRCLLELRPNGLPPLAVSHNANTIDQALAGALDKAKTSLDKTFAKLQKH